MFYDTYLSITYKPLSIVKRESAHTSEVKETLSSSDMLTAFLTNVNQVLPIFSFYIYKVDKKIFKNTRGKSGKYTFIWKYVAPYKRFFLVLLWFIRELKVLPGRTLVERLNLLLDGYFFDIRKT